MANLSYTAAQIDERLAKTDDIGDLTELETTDKDSLVDAVNELFTSVGDGKSAIAAAITDKGVPTAATDTFADMAQNIADIPSPSVQTSKSYTVSASGSTDITPSTGYDAMAKVALTIPAGSATAASTISATGATLSTGTNTLTLSKSVSNTPQVSAGYVSAGTAGTSSVSLTASVTTKAAATIHPSTSDQSVASGTYLTGAQTVKAVTLTNLSAENIKSGVTVKVGDSTDDDCVTSVTGTYTGGGGSSYTKIASQDFTVNTTSTTAYSIGTINLGSQYYTADKIIYVRIRDKAGARNNHFVGTDNYIFNYYKASNKTASVTNKGIMYFSKDSTGAWSGGGSSYGIYVYSLTSAGVLDIYARYGSTSSRTIDGTYNVTVYALDYAPDQGNPFNYSF